MLITKEECSQLLSRYEDALTSRIEGHKQKNRAQNLLELDRWRLTELRQAVQARDPSYMTLSELSKLMDCKLSRGTFRPRLKQLIENNSDKNVKEITEGGFLFAQTNDEEHIVQANLRAIKLLCELQGVGPATATMILQAKYDNVPFMSDEAMLQVFEGDKRKLKYDLRTCGDFMREVEEIRKKLSNDFTAAEIERVLFAKEILGDKDVKSQGPSASISPPPTKASKKRQAEEVKASPKKKKRSQKK